MTEVLISDVVLDLVQILDEAADSGRLVGGEDVTLEAVTTDAHLGVRSRDHIVLTLSNGEKVELRVSVIS